MNINHTQGIIILIILACVLHTNCEKNEKLLSKSDKHLNKASSKSNDDESSSGGKKNNNSVEKMLLNIATIIQSCIDNRTMNNKKFKIKLDNLYKNMVRPIIKKSIKKHMSKVNKIKKQYEEDVEVLKIMNSAADSGGSKNKENPSKRSEKKK